MNSSTSSSRAIYAKILVAVLLGMGVALAAIRVFFLVMGADTGRIIGRVEQARAHLPEIAETDKDLVLFFGSSMVDAGFAPRQFDRQLAERGIDNTITYNFGFGGLNPLYQDYLSRRIGDTLKAKNKRLKLAMIEFNPFQTTKTRRNRALPAEDSYITMLASGPELLEWVKRDPERGIRMLNIRYLRGKISAEMLTFYFMGGFSGGPRLAKPTPEEEAMLQRNRELGKQVNERFQKDFPDYPNGVRWYLDWRGGGSDPIDRDQETLDLIDEYYKTGQLDYRMVNDRQNRVETADILDLNFDEDLVEAFIRIVKNFQGYSDQVEVMMLPRNTKWIDYTPEGQVRLAATIARIERETGITIRNYQDLDRISPEMFSDTTHLNWYSGAVTFTEFLVDTYVAQRKH